MKIISLISGLLMLATLSHANPLPDLGGRLVRVAVENAYPPMQFIDPYSGEAVGWEYDAMNEISRRLNFRVEYVPHGWPGVFASITSGSADISMDVFSFMPRHAKRIDFSDPYLHLETVIVIRADETRFATAHSFPAFYANDNLTAFTQGTVGVIFGTPRYYDAYNFITLYDENAHLLIPHVSFADILENLSAGEIDLTLTNSAYGQAIVAAAPTSFKLVKAPNADPAAEAGYRFLFPKGSGLRAPVNAAIAQMHSDRSFERLTTLWFVEHEIAREAQDTLPYGRGIGER